MGVNQYQPEAVYSMSQLNNEITRGDVWRLIHDSWYY
jgi:hypothetical protein